MKHKYNKVSNTIEADRHSGFTNSAMATAELIDNSIQAGLKTKEKKCEVDLIVIEEKTSIANRQLNRISKIIKNEMINVKDSDLHSFSIPILVDVNIGDNWGVLH